ncbi:hypothetical protein J6590_085424 [Homalodisca vitripennis]|nr:hypothetical protein J6590_085424 [Homalodisca vitripennis]
MAAGEILTECGSCSSKVNSRSKGLRCAGRCGKPFHITCVNISYTDYNKCKDIIHISLWFCDACRFWLGTVKTMPASNPQQTNLDNSSEKLCCECFPYIKILTEEVNNISTNLKAMSENVASVSSEQTKIKSVLNTHSDIISDVMLTESPNLNLERKSYNAALTAGNGPTPGPSNENSSRLIVGTDLGLNRPRPRPQGMQHVKSSGSVDLPGKNESTSSYRPENKKTSNPYFDVEPRPRLRSNSNTTKNIVIGENENLELTTGDKKAWVYLGRLRNDATTDAVKEFIDKTFVGSNPTVEKLYSKGTNASFKIGVEYKDNLFESTIWPKGAIVKRFLFRRMKSEAVR